MHLYILHYEIKSKGLTNYQYQMLLRKMYGYVIYTKTKKYPQKGVISDYPHYRLPKTIILYEDGLKILINYLNEMNKKYFHLGHSVFKYHYYQTYENYDLQNKYI